MSNATAAATQNRLAGKRVTINITRNVNPKQIDQVLEALYRMSGCPACGFLGWDLVFRGGDPEVAALAPIREIGSATVEQIGLQQFGG